MLTIGVGIGCYVLGIGSGMLLTAIIFAYRVYKALERKGHW